MPHSEILGSKLVRSSPRLIAAYHVLHRLSAPRHPPDALKTLDCSHDRCPPSLDDRLEQKDQPPGSRLKAYACRTHPAAVARASQDEVPGTGYVPSSRFQTPTRHVLRRTHGEFLDSSGRRHATLNSHGGGWWSQTGSNRRPQACKASALPTELWPQMTERQQSARSPGTALRMVGLGRLERPTSPLSGVRSNHLSYRPEAIRAQSPNLPAGRGRATKRARACIVRKRGRETKTACPASEGLDWPSCVSKTIRSPRRVTVLKGSSLERR